MTTEHDNTGAYKEIFMSCLCSSPEHTLRVRYYYANDQYEPQLYMDFMLSMFLPWYKRIWPAILYMLGRSTVVFDGAMLGTLEATKLHTIVGEYLAGDAEFERESTPAVLEVEVPKND